MFTILEWLLTIVEVITCILLIIVILLQKSRSEGLGMAFGASMGESLFGARATNVLTKITIWLGSIFLATTTLLAILYAHRSNRAPDIMTAAPQAPQQQQADAFPGVQPQEMPGQQDMPAVPFSPVQAPMPPTDAITTDQPTEQQP